MLAFLAAWEHTLEPLAALLPFYGLLKLALHLVAIAPGGHGAALLFSSLLQPGLLAAGARLRAHAAPVALRALRAASVTGAGLAAGGRQGRAWRMALGAQRGCVAGELLGRGGGGSQQRADE